MRRLFKWIASFFPTPLPIGRAAFAEWAADIIAIAGLPDNRSTRFALACFITEGKAARVSKRSMAAKLWKACANEVAGTLMREAKDEHLAEIAAQNKAANDEKLAPEPKAN